jgi:hypothetical protein
MHKNGQLKKNYEKNYNDDLWLWICSAAKLGEGALARKPIFLR